MVIITMEIFDQEIKDKIIGAKWKKKGRHKGYILYDYVYMKYLE